MVFDGTILTGRRPFQINQLGIARVFQTPEIFSDLSVLHNVMIPAFAKRDGTFTLNMLRALDSGKVAGAGLDVTDPEPLPDDHPLWDYPNVIITPHSSGLSEAAFRRLGELVAYNLQRFLLRQPLHNIVDLELRY